MRKKKAYIMTRIQILAILKRFAQQYEYKNKCVCWFLLVMDTTFKYGRKYATKAIFVYLRFIFSIEQLLV